MQASSHEFLKLSYCFQNNTSHFERDLETDNKEYMKVIKCLLSTYFQATLSHSGFLMHPSIARS
jgi:hypothetical protein